MENIPLSLEEILNNLNTNIAIFDEDGRFIFVNKSYIQLTGRGEEHIIGKTIQDLFNAGVLKNSAAGEVYKVRHTVSTVIETKYKNGAPLYKMVTATPIFDSAGNITNVISEQRDMLSIHQNFREWEAMKIKQRLGHLSRYQDSDRPDLIISSNVMNEFYAVAERVAPTASTVLLCGETGTGKEVVAQFIHSHSERLGNMVSINCASFPETLLEAELFGYESGAFTGASKMGKTGLIELADNSTLFLDEINSLPLNLQAKLLRAIETKMIYRIGATKPRYVNFRLIAATNVDLEESVAQGTFRVDLYYRLNVVALIIPPLRNRKAEIVPLAKHFLRVYGEKYQREKQLSGAIYEKMKHYSWPGNVRELKNFIEKIVVTTDPKTVHIQKIPPFTALDKLSRSAQEEGARRGEREEIITALKENDGHRARTADSLGISRRSLQYKLKKYDIK